MGKLYKFKKLICSGMASVAKFNVIWGNTNIGSPIKKETQPKI